MLLKYSMRKKIPVHQLELGFKVRDEVSVNESTGKQVYSAVCGVWDCVTDVTYGT
jgi:hypothetical protein